jgi:muramoyltetrapeptide carboxypeptidase
MLRPPCLRPGDRVRLISPASTPEEAGVRRCASIFEAWGLRVELGRHVFREHCYLAGTDDERLDDLNEALRDPGIRAIIATRGGRGAYRIADRVDFAAARADPKLVVGFSEITILHLALWKQCRLVGVHGPLASWSTELVGPASVAALRSALMTDAPVVLKTDASEPTAALTTHGRASGILLGGNLDMIASAAGWALPSLDGAILLVEGAGMALGQIDRQLTMLANAGHLNGVRGVAAGQFTNCGTHGEWTAVDILRDRLAGLRVPILGGLPIGHGRSPATLPLGTAATLDADAGVLEAAAVGLAER